MSQEASTEHIRPEELAEYYTETLSEAREEVIEEHLAACAQCTEEARQWHRFASLWDGWTAQAHGAAYQQASLASALQHVQVVPSLQARVRQWLADVQTRAGATLQVALQAGERVSQAIPAGLEPLLAPQPMRTRGAIRTRGGRVRGGTPPLKSVPPTPTSPPARVDVHGDRGVIEVRITLVAPRQPLPLVLLVPMQEEREPCMGTLQQEQSGEFYARFEGVSPGEYLLAFEPAP